MISRIIEVEASAISRGRMITLAETLIIPEITKTEFNYCFTIQCLKENLQKLLCEMQIQGQTHQAAASLQTIQVLSLDKGAHCALRRYNWIADYTIIMLVHKIT